MQVTTPNDEFLSSLAAQVGRHLQASGRRLVTAESCTGGWIGKAMTDVPGSSAWFSGGALVYSNDLKQRSLGVDSKVLAQYGAVSEQTVLAMAEGALSRLGGEVSVAVSGIAGPDGGAPAKPVGTVWFAWSNLEAGRISTKTDRRVFAGDRDQVRRQTVAFALAQILGL